MLASLLIVSIISYLFINGQSSQFNNYPSNLVRGTLYLLSQGIARTQGMERMQWFDEISELLPTKINLISAVEIKKPQQDMQLLYQGKVLVERNHEGALSGWALSKQRENLLLNVDFQTFGQAHLSGISRLMLYELQAQEPGLWESTIKQWQEHFGTRLSLIGPDRLAKLLEPNSATHSKQMRHNLKEGVILQQLETNVSGKPILQIIAAIPNTEEYLLVGPVMLSEVLPYEMFLIYGIVAIVIMGLASYYVVRPLLNRLLSLEETVVKIRRHDLSARVTVDSSDMLGRLAATFNDMAEHIQRLISSQREMTNAVSHELRTPVARIRFGLEFLEDEDKREARAERIQDIDGDIQELERLIDEILTYASLEEGTPSLKLQMVRIDDILAQVKRESDNLGRPIAVEHVPTQEEDDKQLAECEERYIHRVVQNLVGNAMNYGNSMVRISSACDGGMYRIDVEDDGPGIPEDKLEKVFVPFARLDDSRTRSSGGYGLGLSIVQRIAYWHGGLASVSRSSALGGARFTVLWPRMQSLRQTTRERTVTPVIPPERNVFGFKRNKA